MRKVGLFLGIKPYKGGMFQYNQTIIEALNSLPPSHYKITVLYTEDAWKPYLDKYNFNNIKVEINILSKIIRRIWIKFKLSISVWRKISKYIHPVCRNIYLQKADVWIFPSQDFYGFENEVFTISAIHDLMHRYEKRFEEVYREFED